MEGPGSSLCLSNYMLVSIEHADLLSSFVGSVDCMASYHSLHHHHHHHIIKIIIIWFGDNVTVSHLTKCNTNSKVRAISGITMGP